LKELLQLSAELRISIQGENPPIWPTCEQSGTYFCLLRECICRAVGAVVYEGILRISGLDIDWEEFLLNAEQTVAENNRIVDQIVASKLVQTKGSLKVLVNPILRRLPLVNVNI
jgi:hypothetical protein